jgi:integrase
MTPLLWSDFTRQIDELYGAGMREPATRKQMLSVLRSLEPMGVQTTADLTPGLIARFITARSAEVNPRTVHGLLLRIQAACSLAESMNALAVNPFRVRKMRQWIRSGRPVVKNHHTREEIGRVLALMRADVDTREGWAQWKARRLLALTTLVCMTGARRDEACFAWVCDVDLDARVFWIRPRHGRVLKTEESESPVPLPAAAIAPLRDWVEHRLDRPPGFAIPESVPWLFPNLRLSNAWYSGQHGARPIERLQALAKRAGVENATFQSLRRSLACHLEGHGLGQALITRCLRHTSERTTREHYQASDIPNLVTAVEAFEY